MVQFVGKKPFNIVELEEQALGECVGNSIFATVQHRREKQTMQAAWLSAVMHCLDLLVIPQPWFARLAALEATGEEEWVFSAMPKCALMCLDLDPGL